MTLSFNKTQKIIALAFVGMVAMLLNACSLFEPASTTNTGAGGLGSDDPTAAPVASDVPAPSEPTATPIPATYGHIIFVSNRDGQMNLYMTTPDGIEVTRLTVAASDDSAPRISPDGTRVAYTSLADGNVDIYVLDIASRGITRVTNSPDKDTSPTWSPDGTRLAFESMRDGNFEIYVTNLDGSNQFNLTNDPSADTSPVWSPVSDEIAFVSGRFGNNDILLANLNGGVSTLTESVAPNSNPAWSPNGGMIAFQTFAGELSTICVVDPRNILNQKCLTETAMEYGKPVWSPDNVHIAAIAPQSNGTGIDVFDVNDNSVVHLHADGVETSKAQAPAWSPEGARLVFQAKSNGELELFVALIPTNEITPLTATVSVYEGDPIWWNQ